MEQHIKRYLSLNLPQGKSCFLWGARKTGKSTFLRENFPQSIYIDLLEADILQAYWHTPHRLREEILAHPPKGPIIIDEVQKIPALLDQVHALMETQKGLQFILCGSSARRLKTMGANLLGGRAWRYLFVPLCYGELKTLDWKRIFNNGLIPSHYMEDTAEKDLAAYLYDYILTEVQFEANLRHRDKFSRFLDVMGFCHGEILNYANIARDCAIDGKTVRTYFEILEDMYLGYFLRPYRLRSSRQAIQDQPKFYLFDTGMANYLRRYHHTEMIGPLAGKAFEHFIFLELMAYKLLHDKRDDLYFWRTKEGYEVDFIFQDHAIEVKISTPVAKRDLKGLLLFGQSVPVKLHLVSLEPRKRLMIVEGEEVIVWPVREFLDELWAGNLWK